MEYIIDARTIGGQSVQLVITTDGDDKPLEIYEQEFIGDGDNS